MHKNLFRIGLLLVLSYWASSAQTMISAPPAGPFRPKFPVPRANQFKVVVPKALPGFREIRVHVVVAEREDGGLAFDPANFNEQAIQDMLAYANQVYATGKIWLSFKGLKSPDFTVVKNLRIQQDVPDGENPMGSETTRMGYLKQFWGKGKLVLLFRAYPEGAPGPHYKSSNYSSVDADYVVLTECYGPSFAHEFGHYLGLKHTFSEDAKAGVNALFDVKPYNARLEYLASLLKDAVDSGKYPVQDALKIFDGDGLADTPPDPGPPAFQPNNLPAECCTPPASASLPVKVVFKKGVSHTFMISPDKDNIMGYFFGCLGPKHISPLQGKIIEGTLATRKRYLLVSH